MKKALYMLFLILTAEAAFISGRVCLPTAPASEITMSAVITRRRASKADADIMQKVLPVEYKRLMADRNFHEDIARYYADILVNIGYF